MNFVEIKLNQHVAERTKITEIIHKNALAIKELNEFDIRLYSPWRNLIKNQSCFGYAIGGSTKEFVDNYLRSVKHSKYEPHAIAVYYFDNLLNVDNVRHMGKVAENDKIISRWNVIGNVYIHPIDMIPLGYGNRVCFFEDYFDKNNQDLVRGLRRR